MSLLLPAGYNQFLRGSSFERDTYDTDFFNRRSLRSHSALPESFYQSGYDSLPTSLVNRALSTARDIIEEPSPSSTYLNYGDRWTTRDTFGRLGDILGRGDDSWLDRYVSNGNRAPKTKVYVSTGGREYPIRRRFLTSSYDPYTATLPGFYRYAHEQHWSRSDPAKYGYLLSTPYASSRRLGGKNWDWAYPHRSYTSNFSPFYIHYPLSSRRYI